MSEGRNTSQNESQPGALVPSLSPFQLLQLALVIRRNLKKLKKIHGNIYGMLNPTELVSMLVNLSTFLAQQGTGAPSFNLAQQQALYVIEKGLLFLAEDLKDIQKIANTINQGESAEKVGIEVGKYTDAILDHVYCLTYCGKNFPGPTETDATITAMAISYAKRQTTEKLKKSFNKFTESIKEKMNEVKFGLQFYELLDGLLKAVERTDMDKDQKEIAIARLKAIKFHRGRTLKTVYPDQVRDLSNFMFTYHEKFAPFNEKFEEIINEETPPKLAAYYVSIDEINAENNVLNSRINESLRKIYNKEIQELVDKKTDFETRLNTESENIKHVDKEIEELKHLIQENEEKKVNLNKPLSDKEKEQNRNTLKKLQEEEEKLRKDYNLQSTFLQTLEEQRKTILNTKSLKNYKRDIEKTNEDIELLKQTRKEINKRKIDSNYTKTMKKEEMDKIETEIKTLKARKEMMVTENKKYFKDKEIQKIEGDIKRGRQALLEMQILLDKNSKTRARYEMTDKNIQEVIDHHKKEIIVLENKSKDSAESKKKIQDEIDIIQQKIKALEVERPSIMESPLSKMKRKKDEFQKGIKDLLEKMPFRQESDKEFQSLHKEEKLVESRVPEENLAIFQLRVLLKEMLIQSGNKNNVELKGDINTLKDLLGEFLHKDANQNIKNEFQDKCIDAYINLLLNMHHKEYSKVQGLDGQIWRLIQNEKFSLSNGPLFLMRKARSYQGGKHPRTTIGLMEAAKILNEQLKIDPQNKIALNDEAIKRMVDKAIEAMNEKLTNEGRTEGKFLNLKLFGENKEIPVPMKDLFLRRKLEKRIRQAIQMEPRAYYEKPLLSIGDYKLS